MKKETIKIIKLREQGLSYTEIAKVLDMPLGSVKVTVFRLRNRQPVPWFNVLNVVSFIRQIQIRYFAVQNVVKNGLKKI